MDKIEGWKLVPVEPTDHMRGLGRAMQLGGTATARNIYQTMLAAAPTPPAQEFPWEPCNEGCAEVGKTQHCTCEQAKAFMAAQEPHTAIRTLKEGINTVPAHPDIGDTPPAQEAVPVAWVDVKDTYEGPYEFHGMEYLGKGKHHLYTRPASDELRKAAEELWRWIDEQGAIIPLHLQRNLRVALEKK